jgi:hypothetical protein
MEMKKDEIIDQMMGFFRTKVITSALELGVFDALADGPATAGTISQRIDIPVKPCKRLLIALLALGLLGKEHDEYKLSLISRQYMLRSSSEWLGWLARHIDIFLYPLWSKAALGIRENKDQRMAVFGDNRSWFDILYENPDDVEDFQEFLGIFAKPFIEGMIQGFDFSLYRRFMDIGSGIGTLPMAVADRYPGMDISICELPQAAAFLRAKMKSTEYGERIKVVEGDVISGDLPENEYDLIHLGWMLHDYSTEIQKGILANIYKALPSGGTLIASETPLADDERGPLFVSLLSINMLLSTDGGIESTGQQYIKRFGDAGFINVKKMEIQGPRTLFCGVKE